MPPSERRPAQLLRRVAVRGVTTLFAASVASKLAGMATIYVTGLVFSKSDFALYAIAIAWGEIFGFMQNGGLHRFLLQRAKAFDNLFAPILGLSFIFNGAWFLSLLVLAPIIGRAYDAPGVEVLFLLFGLSILASTVALLLRSYLMLNLRFAELSRLNVYATLIRNGGVISLALAGLGPASFMIPLIAVNLFESVYLSRKRPGSWRPSIPPWRLVKPVAQRLRWVLLSALAMALITNGDYLVIGALMETALVGVYFFAFQLTVAVLTVFTMSLRSVFTPSFIALGDDPVRQENAFLRSLEASSILLFFVIFSISAVAEPVIGIVWSGKWDAAVPVVEIIAATSLSRVLAPLAVSLLEARGAWRTVAAMSWVEGLGLMASAAVGVSLGGLIAVAWSIGASMIIVGLLYLFVIFRHTDLSAAALARAALLPQAIAAGALAISWSGAAVLAVPPGSFVDALAKGGGYIAGFALLLILFGRHVIRTVIALIGTVRRKSDVLTTD